METWAGGAGDGPLAALAPMRLALDGRAPRSGYLLLVPMAKGPAALLVTTVVRWFAGVEH